MSDTSTEAQSVVVERELPHPPEKVWRVLTEPLFIEEWLQKNDFKPLVNHTFQLDFDWGVVDCRVLAVEAHRTLSYTWVSGELDTVVTWTLTPTESGTRLQMVQTGFRPTEPGQSRYFGGARAGWPRFFDAIDDTLAKLDRMTQEKTPE